MSSTMVSLAERAEIVTPVAAQSTRRGDANSGFRRGRQDRPAREDAQGSAGQAGLGGKDTVGAGRRRKGVPALP